MRTHAPAPVFSSPPPRLHLPQIHMLARQALVKASSALTRSLSRSLPEPSLANDDDTGGLVVWASWAWGGFFNRRSTVFPKLPYHTALPYRLQRPLCFPYQPHRVTGRLGNLNSFPCKDAFSFGVRVQRYERTGESTGQSLSDGSF